ncbi:MAG TPA: AAA family ATPase [Polyangia bacterium]
MWNAAWEFGGTDRFQVLRRIGAGGMGVVYEAHDRERGQKVALKTIANPGSDTLFRLKREFRALADLSHPNLATLYDLVIEERGCFFTMELIDGDDFLRWVRAMDLDPGAFAPTMSSAPSDQPTAHYPPPSVRGELPAAGGSVESARDPVAPRCDEARLRAGLCQLGLGLEALHAAGKIHRDIKPSNLLVTREGRVVLLDFGLVAEIDEHRDLTDSGEVVGTVGYMAPEQAAGDPRVTPAADWYAVGVLLYQTLTGRLPFSGPSLLVLQDKQRLTPAPPRALVPAVPRDLDELCVQLLSRLPGERPSGAEVLRRLGVQRGTQAPLVSRSRDRELAGRALELAALEESLDAVARGNAACAVVRGLSGIGKSALVQRLFERARQHHPKLVILPGRCYEREAVPYKAMDSLIDRLSSHWLQLPPAEARALLPADAALLPTLFPVLGRVPAVADAPGLPNIADAQEIRTRAFGALREVLQRLAACHPMILFIDDLQWVDADTITLLTDLMRAPDPPALLLLLATRVEGSEAVLGLARGAGCEHRVVEVGPLAPEAASALALEQLGDDPASRQLAEQIAREASGSPFFLLELARYMQGRSLEEMRGKTLDEVLLERVGGLGEQARALVEVVAVAGEPMALRAAGLAANLTGEALARQLAALRAERFVRAAGGRSDDQVEPYHDRVREAVVSSLDGARRAKLHRAIATALTGQAPAARLARHWHGAGDKQRAAEYARRAAEEAIATLDFDRAAGLYRMALDLGEHSSEERRTLRTRLGAALGNAGRPVEASREFALAAADSDATTALELRRRAADALLRGGYIDEGLEATRTILGEIGLELAKTPGRALASLIARRAWLRVRGLGFSPRPLSAISQPELTRVDVCEGVALGLVMVDTFRSMDFSARFLHEALRLGERWRIARAFALEADFLAVQAKVDRAEALLARLEAITSEIDTPQARAQLMTTRGMIEFLCHNRWRSALESFTTATAIFRAHESTAGFEIDTVGIFCCWALYYLGELGELARRVPGLVHAATRGGDRYAAVTYRAAFPSVWLVRDAPEEAEREVVDAIESWTSQAGVFQLQHLFALTSRCDLAIYRGEPERAQALVEAARRPLSRSMLERAPSNKLLLASTLGRLAIACGAQAPSGSAVRRQAAAEARHQARELERSPQPAGRASSGLLRAGAAELDGDRHQAVAELRRTVAALDAIDTRLFAAAGRRRLGLLLGGDEGSAMIAAAEAWLSARGVENPARFAAMIAPGPT